MAVEDFANGANILQQVDVSQIFKSLAMGIAEAQQELDDNSISQLERLSETELAGKSLLELGFVPAFYAFTYADISANINLRMAQKTSLELGVEASFDYSSGSSGSSDFSELSQEKQFQSEQTEYKSNRAFTIESSSKKQIKVNNQFYQLDENVSVVSRLEKLQKELMQDEKISRVNMQYSNSYYTVYNSISDYSILTITNTNSSQVVTTPASFTFSGQNFQTMFNAFVGSTTIYGFIQAQIYGPSTSPIDFDLYFDSGLSTIDFAYDLNLKGVANKPKVFEALATILKNDPALQITIEGSCDRVAKAKFNEGLSTRRCEAMRNWLVAKGANKTQINIAPKGETLAATAGDADGAPNPDFRRVRITLPSTRAYIFFLADVGGVISGSGNTFINVAYTATENLVVVNGNSSQFQTGATVADYESNNVTSSTGQYESETREGIHYFLKKKTQVTYMAYSENSEEIEMSAEEGSESEVKVYKNESSKERIKNIAEKNNSNKTFAASASLDFRMSRQFEMSMEGSSSMSARMVAVPAPEAFTTHILTAFNPPA